MAIAGLAKGWDGRNSVQLPDLGLAWGWKREDSEVRSKKADRFCANKIVVGINDANDTLSILYPDINP